ncbi:MAG: GMC family oxidoreductase [Alphaproteobacteria bacterium]|nr:GMC family oxidoreductase [Alphaproteobacteria bacterium]
MERFDAIVVGSGFGGSVSALRLSEKGYRVLVVEQGRRFRPEDFPKTNWDLRRFMWNPRLGMRGPFRMTFLPHVTVLSGVGVGGGSLVYANTLPVPKTAFFEQGSWAGVRDWQQELAPHYATAKRMLGAVRNPHLGTTDQVLRAIAEEDGRLDDFSPTDVAVYFGERAGQEVEDPFFEGKGPRRTGCNLCGGCMLGCRHGAKNTLDKNYLYLAEQLGTVVLPETKVVALRPEPGGGYRVVARPTRGRGGDAVFVADKVVLAGGVLGTSELLLSMKADRDGLPELSDHVGRHVRTNSESIVGVTASGDADFTKGVAIGSILHTDDHSHLEPVRYPPGSGLFRTMILPHAPGRTLPSRLAASLKSMAAQPRRAISAMTVRDWSKSTAILLFMQSTDGTLDLRLGRLGLTSRVGEGVAPTADIPEASALAARFADKLDGFVVNLFTETLAGIPTTAHVLGGACIGTDASTGVIGHDHQVFGYPGLYVCDGSAVSANPGVNPSLTITAMTERAMTLVPARA